MTTFSDIERSDERLDDGVPVDYAMMMRMWSAFHRSIIAFERECGVLSLQPLVRERPQDKRRRSC